MSKSKTTIRKATHAFSWYTGNPIKLTTELEQWYSNAVLSESPTKPSSTHTSAIIVPHAGYTYCGKTAGYCWANITPKKLKHIFVLGPSHVVSFSGIALPPSSIQSYETPLGAFSLDMDLINEFENKHSNLFQHIPLNYIEKEHSLEMMLPFLAFTLKKHNISISADTCPKIIPLTVGNMNQSQYSSLASLFAPYLGNEDSLFVISSDFCHWGSRFGFSPYDPKHGKVFEYISHLDHMGMKVIETQNFDQFQKYLNKTSNTICGRNPISILLKTIENSSKQFSLSFVDYSQSSQITDTSDSSVSYAAGVLKVKPQPDPETETISEGTVYNTTTTTTETKHIRTKSETP